MPEVQHWATKEKFEKKLEKSRSTKSSIALRSANISPRLHAVIKLKCHFARYNCPETVINDNGPQLSLRSIFGFSSKVWEFNHRIIRHWNTKANGKVEAAVKVAKQLLRKTQGNTDAYMALLNQTNTQTQGMATSPAKRFMSRRTKTLLLTKEALLCLEVPNADEQQHKLQRGQETCTSTLL